MNSAIVTPEALAMKHHFLQPLMVTAVYADPSEQARYDLARLELSLQMAKSTLKDRVCLHCTGPIWYNTFLMEWFHASPETECPVTTGPTPAPLTRKRTTKE